MMEGAGGTAGAPPLGVGKPLLSAGAGPGGASLPAPPSLAAVVDAAAAGLALSEASSVSLDDEGSCQAAIVPQEANGFQQGQPPAGSTAVGDSGAAGGCSRGASWRPSQAELAASATYPLLLAAHQGLPQQNILSHNPLSLPVNTGSPIEFDTPMFSGRACVWVRGLPGAPDDAFAGRRRRTLVTVQGCFRRPVAVDDLVTGQEFSTVEKLPPAWLVEGVLLKLARAVSPASQIGPLSAPHLLMPVAAGCSEMSACRPGEEPDPAAPPQEDLRAWDANLTLPDGSPMPANQRKAFFARASNRAGRCFPTHLVFTFHFYQHWVDVSKYELDVLLYRFDLCKHLRGQPLQLMMRERSSGEYAYCLHLWHSRLLRAAAG